MNARVNAIRYEGPGYLALNVTNLAKSADFYEHAVGLQRAGETPEGEILFQCSDKHHDLLLAQAPEAGFKRMSWIMESEAALEAAFAHFAELGIIPRRLSPAQADALGLSRSAFRIQEPHSKAVMEFSAFMQPAAKPFRPTSTKIQRLGHVVIGVENLAEAEKFYLEDMNFRVSDRIDGAVTHLRCFPNKWHHTFGLGGTKANKFHHVNFMVTEIDDIGKAVNRMRAKGVPIVYGPGRHPQSGSMYLYFIDPDGLWVEYSFGMEEFTEVDPRSPRKMALTPENMDAWGGPPPDARYPHKGIIDAAAP
ncbi:MAG: VOC family protein [Hyphomonadaceae bacterium]